VFAPDDTIVAIATPPGRGGLGVVRVSGADAQVIALGLVGSVRPLVPRYATLCHLTTADGLADQVVLTYFRAPHSYTGEDVVEISAHGSPVLLRGIVAAAFGAGARLAEPGEFTFRAYLHGRIDLVQAEAVRDLVEAVTPTQVRIAFDQLEGTVTERIRAVDARLVELIARLEASLDFPEEGYHFLDAGEAGSSLASVAGALDVLLQGASRGRVIRDGVTVAIVGRPNAGKSSLFNQLAGAGRAIVTAQPGTTRDLLTELIDVDGIPMTIVDTAGLHDAAVDAAEREGIVRAAAARDAAAAVVVVLDGSVPLTGGDHAVIEATAGRPRVLVANKSDLPASWPAPQGAGAWVRASARTGAGMDDVRQALVRMVTEDPSPAREEPALTNVRHIVLVTRARDALRRGAAAAASGTPEEFVLTDVHEARHALEEVTGRRTAEDVLRLIFEKFCIGK
jgi:tRNA modification GTPase